tara:strand:+ start:90871 stop:91488 length:618 start_codon:yes stop_codon:yes gene_type:complete
MRKKTKINTSKNLNISNKASTDNKLTYVALLLNYAFEYGVDFKNRTITITGELAHGWFDIVDAALTQMEAESKSTVTIKVNSPGGDTYEAMAIIGRIKNSKCHIVTEGYGHIMSAATLILACGNKRKMSRYAQFMWHEASYGIEERHSVIKATVAQVEREETKWAEAMSEFTNKSVAFWKKTGVGIDKYLEAEQLLEYGAIDEII